MARLGLATLVSLWCRRAAGETFNLQADSLHDRVTSLSQPSLSDLHFMSPPYAEPQLEGDTEAIELLDTVLVASVDGRFHAIDRTTGVLRWSMSSADEAQMQSVPGLGPLVRSRSPIVDRDDWDPDWDTYVIEPQSGDIFVVPSHAGPSEPLHKLGISVDTLVEHSPFSIYGDKPRTFIGKKETSLLSIDLRTGRIASFVNVADECKWDDEESDAGSALASLHEPDDDRDDRTRGRSPTVSIGRTDYYVTVYAGGKKIQHLSYSRYGPNNVDNSIQTRWTETPDALYMQSHPRGHLWAFSTNQSEVDWRLPHFEHPIVSIFDVVTVEGRADPVALLQPRPLIGDLIDINKNQADAIYAQLADRTYVGKIANALYAMSAKNFPLVAFDMQDRQTRPANDDGEPDSGYHIGGWHEECTKPECMVGRWRTHDVRADPRNDRFIDGPKSDLSISKTIEITTTSIVTSTPTSTRASDASNTSVSTDVLPALWSSPKAYGPAAAFMVAIFLWVVIQKTSSILPHRSRSTAAEHKVPANETTARSPDMTPVPPTPVAAPVDMSARPVTPIPPLEPPVVLTVATLPEAEVPDPVSDSGAQGGDDGSDGEDDDKDDAATPGKRRRRRKRVRKPKNKAVSGDQGGDQGVSSDAKEDGKDDAFVLVEGDVPVYENISPNVQLVVPTPASPVAPTRISPASLVVSETVLGFGSHGTIVYQGSFQGRAVAVKRLLGDFTTLATREVELLQESDDHPNVIRYFFKEHRDNFLYIALELCPASLADIIDRPDVFRDISIEFDPKRALSQITAGIRHLHSLKIIHRDIKPQNILISHTKNGARRMLISDFGLCKKLDHDQTSFLPTMHGAMAAGTVGWRAPEILRGDVALDPMMASDDSQQSRGSTASGHSPTSGTTTTAKRLTKSVDVFALGCLFYYTLTNGDHPYGDRFERESNILKNAFRLDELERLGEEGIEAMDLIAMMLDPEPKSRPDTLNVLLHPFFWTPGRRLAFLQDASDRFEIMCRDPRDQSLVELETGAHGVVGNDWHTRLDRIFIDNLGKFRKYDGRTVQDLLRALRNKKHHYQDMPDNVKRHLGPLPEGFLAYFTRRFPALFMHVHAVISRTGLNTEPMFRSYFELAES